MLIACFCVFADSFFTVTLCTSLLSNQMLLFLSVFENLGFSPVSLMEAFVEKVIARPDDLTLKDLLCVLKVYSSLNYDLQQHRQQ